MDNAGEAGIGKTGKNQRVYIKISPDHEEQGKLVPLKQLLQKHSGHLQVALFYERNQKAVALSDAYRVKPSPELFQAVETLLGASSIRVK
ncbi:hypothetical protein P7H20_03335 [Paenibacillus larvae]|nr:hypothetical protein [Paenibacillus larvae]MDT2274109.1 hypothetical protein [Paenibacillus larvae]